MSRTDRDVLGYLAKDLNEEITATIKGKKQKISKAEYLGRSVITDALPAPLAQKLKALETLNKLGLLKSLQLEGERISELEQQVRDERERGDRRQLVAREKLVTY